MHPSDTLKAAIQKLEKDRNIALDGKKVMAQKQLESQEKADKIYENMGWRERYLPKWIARYIGANIQTMDSYNNQNKATSRFESKAFKHDQKAFNIDQKITDKISNFLRANDATYRSIIIPLEAAIEFQKTVHDISSLVHNALNEIDDAQSMETMDLFTKNKGISLMSTFANSDARTAVNDVKSAMPAFETAARQYHETYKDFSLSKVETEFGDLTDLVFDFAFDGFDFMSIFSLNALGLAEDNLEQLLADINQFESAINNQAEHLSALRDECINRTRQVCVP